MAYIGLGCFRPPWPGLWPIGRPTGGLARWEHWLWANLPPHSTSSSRPLNNTPSMKVEAVYPSLPVGRGFVGLIRVLRWVGLGSLGWVHFRANPGWVRLKVPNPGNLTNPAIVLSLASHLHDTSTLFCSSPYLAFLFALECIPNLNTRS